MAENTAELKRLHDQVMVHQTTFARVHKLEQTLDSLVISNEPSRLDRLEASMDTITRSIDTMSRQLERVVRPDSVFGNSHNALPIRSMKLDFPKFDGSAPLNWLFHVEQFFALYQTPDAQRLAIAAIHMDGDAGPWFQMLQRTNLLPNWQALVHAIEAHFGPSPFDSPRAALFKLQQTDFVQHYSHEFSSLANRVEGLTDSALLDCFISGLKHDVKREVLVQAPTSFVKVVALAKLYDAKPMSYSQPSKKPLVSSSQHRYPGPFSCLPLFHILWVASYTETIAFYSFCETPHCR